MTTKRSTKNTVLDATTDAPDAPKAAFAIGSAYFIRTVTYHLTGRVVAKIDGFLVLEDAAWIGDSGRFMQAIKQGRLSEVEPVGDALVNVASITDAFPWRHALPMEQI